MDSRRRQAIKNKLENYINAGSLLGGGISGAGQNAKYTYVAGHRDIAKTQPFTEDTIIRCASDSKIMGTVAFLKLIERGEIDGKENLSTWIPAFANTKVIDPYFPLVQSTLTNPFLATVSSAVLSVTQIAHGLVTGDVVGFQNSGDVQGVSAAVINQVYSVTVVDDDHYTVTLPLPASGTSPSGEGGSVLVVRLSAGVKQTSYQGVIHYYKEIALKRPITIWHVLTHTLGYLYNQIALGVASGYADGRNDPLRVKKSLIQAGILQSLLLPAAFPLVFIPGTYPSIKNWAATLATVPLLFQPGEDWSYGPSLSILGALIEYIDGRDLETYFRQEITEPLGMKDTGFFIQDDDPRRADKLSRIQTLTLTAAPGVFLDVNTIIPGLGDYFYGSSRPRNLPLIDGGLYSTLADREKFYKMLLNKGQYKSKGHESKFIISPAMISLLSHNRVLDLVPGATFPPIKNAKWGLGVAVGAGIDAFYPLMGETKNSIFWGGVFGTNFTVDWTNQSFSNFVVNTVSSTNLGARLTTLHYAALEEIQSNDDNVSSNASESVSIYH